MPNEPPPLDLARHALFLDFDGTFVDFAPEPDAIALKPGSIALLQRLGEALGGAFALVSGRRLDNLDRHLAPLRPPAAGLHGQELRRGEAIEARPSSPELGLARRTVRDRLGPDDPIRVEDKGGSIVLHFRTAPDQRDRALAIAEAAVAGRGDLHAQPGHAIVEIRQKGIGKADAVRAFAERPPFAGRLPVFVGDDTTDEDGFRAAQALGGFGIKVGEGESAARHRLPDVAAVHSWLAAAARR